LLARVTGISPQNLPEVRPAYPDPTVALNTLLLPACQLTLLTALDLPWRPDGLQRDGPHVRDPVDAKIRAALGAGGLPYCVVAGHGPARLQAALAAVDRALNPPPDDTNAATGARWRWHCERCGDASCERHALLPRER